ncbi:MAG: NAD-dependent deacylase [Flavobacteriales bacterium]|nr:NAD-dependent deacylase [Flavobacteriales bacterium]
MRVVVLSGAGISAESGLRTFRDSDGLWEHYRVADVATPEAWARNPELVLRFYDERRAQVLNAQPNAAHLSLARLEEVHNVQVVTQNIDDLHERAGSTHVLHLHGEILKARSTADPAIVTPMNGPSLTLGSRCPLGSQLRPHIVWFGEEVPLLPEAYTITSRADVLLVIGTSLNVYPAAGLIHAARPEVPVHLVDPGEVVVSRPGVRHWRARATQAVPDLVEMLYQQP